MASVKTRVALTGGKYLVTHPRGRLTRIVVRFVARRIAKKVGSAPYAEAIPATGGSRLVTVGGVVVVAGGIVVLARRTSAKSAPAAPAPASTSPAPAPYAPFAATAGAPPETRDAPPTTQTADPVAEAAASDAAARPSAASAPFAPPAGKSATPAPSDEDGTLAARVIVDVFDGTPPEGVTVESQLGVVTLRGPIADADAEVRLVREAEGVDGVKAVQSELQPATVDPGLPPS